jgi:hypothetical protein
MFVERGQDFAAGVDSFQDLDRRSRGISGSGRRKYKLDASGRLPRPISYTSRNPWVVIRPARAPLRSMTVLMAVVEPSASTSTWLGSNS